MSGSDPIPRMDRDTGAVPAFCASCGSLIADTGQPCPCTMRPSPELLPATAHFAPIRFAILLYFLLLAAALGLGIAHHIAGPGITARFQVSAELTYDAIAALLTIGACVLLRKQILPLLRLPKQRRWLLYAPGLALVTYTTAMAVSHLWHSLLNLPRDPQQYTGSFIACGVPWLAYLSIALMPGVFEELSFRGAIGTSLRKSLEPREAAIVTALLFASIHLDLLMFVNLLWIGLILALLVARSGSLIPGMLLHICHNALCITNELVPEFPG